MSIICVEACRLCHLPTCSCEDCFICANLEEHQACTCIHLHVCICMCALCLPLVLLTARVKYYQCSAQRAPH